MAVPFTRLSIKIYCVPIATQCEWNEWKEGECSRACGIGLQTNMRTKKVAEANGGTCIGQPTEVVECNTQTCPGNVS